jgi:hypothetical protein
VGLVDAVGAGQSMLFAADPATGIVSQPVTLTVAPAQLEIIGIYAYPSIGNTSLDQGTQLQFYATGYYGDGTTQDITTSVTWASSSPTIASISNTSPSNGLVTGLSVGTASITATLLGNTASILVAITPVGLTSITVTPANITRGIGCVQQFTATGSYASGATFDITNFVTWDSLDLTVAEFGLSPSTPNGEASCIGSGQTWITATDPGSGISSPLTTFTVTP